jgi:hypothetical protein
MRRVAPKAFGPGARSGGSRGRSDCQKVSTYRDAVGGLRAADRMERSGHRRNGYFLARPALTGGSKFRSNFRQ